MRTPSILVVDNDEEYVATLQLWLEREFRVEISAANSKQKALELAKEKPFDLAVIDLRLERESDYNDYSGLELCHLLPSGIVRVLLTGHGKLHENALPDWGRSETIHKYLVKDRNIPKRNEQLLEALTLCRTNFDLKIRFNKQEREPDDSAWGALLNAEISSSLTARGNLFSMLIHRLFTHDIEQVDIEPVTAGASGSGVLRANVTHKETQLTEHVIVKYGSKNVGKERSNFAKYVAPLGPRWSAPARWDASVELFHGQQLCAIAYWLAQPHRELTTPARFLNEALEDPRIRPEDEAALVTALFSNMCRPWHRAIRKPTKWSGLEGMSIREYYLSSLWTPVPPAGEPESTIVVPKTAQADQKVSEIRAKLHRKKQALIQGKLLELLPESRLSTNVSGELVTFSDPLALLDQEFTFWPELSAECIVHGDLHMRNICLIDRDPCLIDFGDCGYGHVFRDFAMLEISIRFGHFYPTLVLPVIWALENRFVSYPMLTPNWNVDEDSSSEHVSSLTMRIRQEAHLVSWRARARKLFTENSQEVEYAIAMFFSLLKMAGIERLDGDESEETRNARRLIAFIAAGKISEWLPDAIKSANV